MVARALWPTDLTSGWAVRYDPAAGFGPPLRLNRFEIFDVTRPAIALDDRGDLFAAWTSSFERGGEGLSFASAAAGEGFADPALLREVPAGVRILDVHVLAGRSRRPVVVWLEDDGTSLDLWGAVLR